MPKNLPLITQVNISSQSAKRSLIYDKKVQKQRYKRLLGKYALAYSFNFVSKGKHDVYFAAKFFKLKEAPLPRAWSGCKRMGKTHFRGSGLSVNSRTTPLRQNYTEGVDLSVNICSKMLWAPIGVEWIISYMNRRPPGLDPSFTHGQSSSDMDLQQKKYFFFAAAQLRH